MDNNNNSLSLALSEELQHQVDHELVERVLSGEREAFEQFFRSYQPRLMRFAAKNMPANECEDVVQLTLTRAFRYLHTYRGEASLYTWVCQICLNMIRTWYRKKKRNEQTFSSFDQSPELMSAVETIELDLTGVEADRSREELVENVQSALDTLPPKYEEVLRLKYLSGFSLLEISAKCELSSEAVQSLLARARKAFRRAFVLIDLPQKTAGEVAEL